MKYNFFAIPARNSEADEAALNSFCSQHRVTFIEKQLVADGAQSFWSVCITYRNDEEVGSGSKDQRKPRVDLLGLATLQFATPPANFGIN